MSTATIASNSSLARKQWGDVAYAASTSLNPFFNLMGDGKNGTVMNSAVIREQFDVGAGDTKSYPFRALKASNPVLGNNRVQGTGSQLTYASDTITVDRIREELTEFNTTMTEQRTKVDVENDTANELGRLSAMATARYAMAALTDVTSGRTQKRYQYGSTEANWNATHATALANVSATTDKLSLSMLRNTAVKMKTSTSGVGFMRPAQVINDKTGVIKPKFIGLFHPRAIIDLKSDTNFNTQVFQGQNDMFDVVSGANYIGEYEGIAIYEFLPLDGNNDTLFLSGVGASGANVAHNLILGAGALVIADGKVAKPKGSTKYSMSQNGSMMVTTVDDDHGGDAAWAYTKVQGYRKLVDQTVSGGEDFGVFHLFTGAAGGF